MTHRRNGSAVFEYIQQIDWKPKALFLAGVGVEATEAISFHEDWPDAEIIGFEPNPVTFQGLLSTFPGKLIQAALSDKNEEAPLYFHHAWKNGSSLFRPEVVTERTQSIPVPVMRLDTLLAVPDTLLWLDVEGNEFQALTGAGKFLTGVKAINIEMSGRPRSSGWSKPRDIHNWLTARGFLQSYVHTIRTIRAQFDSIYLHRSIFKPEMCSVMDSLGRV